MLDSHRNLLEPRPSDRLRIGDCVLDIPLREITRSDDGEPTRITLKAEGVLLVLVANAGKVVSREALMEWVWPDTMPTDDVITQAVTQLRKALGNGQVYIETIAKQGYRLLAPVEWIDEEDDAASRTDRARTAAGDALDASAPAAGEAPSGRSRPNRAWAIGVAATLALVSIGVLLWTVAKRQAPAASTAAAVPQVQHDGVPIRRVTAFPGAELWPSFSPDGTLLVYSQTSPDGEGTALRLQAPASATARSLTESAPRQRDLYPVWSPDGREIAFVRMHEEQCAVMLVSAAGSEARRVGGCLEDRPHPLAWYPDGRNLIGAASATAFAQHRTTSAVHRMRLDEGLWQPVEYERAASDVDVHPKVSPDGRWIVFQRNISVGDLWRMPVGGGRPMRLTDLRTNLFGFDWTRGSSGLILSYYSSSSRPRLSHLDLNSGRLSDYSGGDSNLVYPTVAAQSGEVAFMIDDSHSVIRQLDPEATDGDGGTGIFESSASNMAPGVSPDGRQLTFISDRTGEVALWWVDRQAPETLKAIEGFHPLPRFPVRWNPGSTRFLAVGNEEQSRALYEIDPRSGRVLRLALPGQQRPTHADYHVDPGKLLVVAERGQGRLGLTLYDRSRTPWRPLRRIDDVALALMDGVRDRVVFARYSTAQVWAADADLRNPRLLDSVTQPWRLRTLAVADDGVWVMDAREGCDWWWRPVGRDADGAAGRCLRASASQLLEGLSRATAQAAALFVSIGEDKGADIGFLPASAFATGTEPMADASR
jgi:DNA-binding winged helix-turn-helix (wHTH) protein/Tol biopolymer transport system component